VLQVTSALFKLGAYEVSLGGTIGVGGAGDWRRLLTDMRHAHHAHTLAVHAHDAYGKALANVLTAVEVSMRPCANYCCLWSRTLRSEMCRTTADACR
jgi:hypothetical protein